MHIYVHSLAIIGVTKSGLYNINLNPLDGLFIEINFYYIMIG